MKKAVLILICLLVIGPPAAWGLSCLVYTVAFPAGPNTTVYGQATSPDRQREARVQFNDCGVTCGVDREVLVHSRVFPFGVCRVLWLQDEPVVMLHWRSVRVLQVSYSAPREDIEAESDHCGDVQVRFNWTPPARAD